MDRDILFQPDSRFLSSSAANDFSLYGGQPEPGLSFRLQEARAPDAASAGQPQPSPGTAAPTEASGGSQPLSTQAIAPTLDSGSPTSSLQPLNLAPRDVEVAAIAPESVPLSSPLIPLQPQPVSDAHVFAPIVTSQLPAAETATAPVQQAALDLPAAALAPALATVATAPLAPVDDLVDTIISPVVGVVPALLDGVTDGVQDLLGSDPVAGISTLVSLVTIEVIDLAEVVTTPLEAVSSPVELIDLLAGDADDAGEVAPLPIALDDLGVDDLLDQTVAAPLHSISPLPDPNDLFGP